MRPSAAVAVLVLLAACGPASDESGVPEAGDVVRELLVSIDTGSCADVRRLVVTPDAVDCEQIEDLAGSYSAEGVDLDDLSVSVGEVVDGSATVTVDLGADEERWQVEDVAGQWRVLLDSTP